MASSSSLPSTAIASSSTTAAAAAAVAALATAASASAAAVSHNNCTTTTAATTTTATAITATNSNSTCLVPSESAATVALVTYLRTEADLSEQKAKSLRAQADQLAALYGITDDFQERYELGPNDVPPLDEHGVPKYRGKKRGRKPRERKRKANPNRRKRGHTAYTLFVQELYPGIKSSHPGWPSKDVISLVAKMWAEVPANEKREWKDRALATHGEEEEEEEEEEGEEEDEEELDEEQEEEGDDENDADHEEDDEEVQNEIDDKGSGGGGGGVNSSGHGLEGVNDEEDVDRNGNLPEVLAPSTSRRTNTRRKRR